MASQAQHAPRKVTLERTFNARIEENVGGIRERDVIAICVRAVDVVETDGVLGNNSQAASARLKQFRIDLVAQSVGYSSEDVFRRAFERRFGVSPSSYRARFPRNANPFSVKRAK